MQTLAIIAEYNPFHKGHAYHIQQSKKMIQPDCVFALMSGSVVQRGSFALVNKWLRTETALCSGVDLVCELPYAYAAQSAEYFADGALKILNHIGCCDALSFGSESGDLPLMQTCAEILNNETKAFKTELKIALNFGFSFPKARQLALSKLYDEKTAACLREPNNILGIEYLKALLRSKSTITPITIPRHGSGYHDEKTKKKSFASATALRQALKNKGADSFLNEQLPYPPELLLNELNNHNIRSNENYTLAIRNALMLKNPDTLTCYPYVSEGLEFKLKKALEYEGDVQAIINHLISKRMPESRIRRILMNLILDFKKEDLNRFNDREFIPYLRVLGFNKKGQCLLKKIKATSDMPIITNTGPNLNRLTPDQKALFDFDVRATDLFNLYNEKKYCYHRDYTENPIILT
ncbi:MAG: nucleotidyltransferase [Eubacterium sp.]